MDKISGGCQCGKVRFEAHTSPDRVGICHCLDCRKHHGAVFFAAAIFSEADVSVTGETNHYEGRHFCPNCGSSVFAKSDDEIELHLGSIDRSSQFKPDYELWTNRKEDWLPDFPCTKKYDKNRNYLLSL